MYTVRTLASVKVLPNVRPTRDQLPIVTDTKPGVLVVRGAAGSGKTTTALLRLRQLGRFWERRREDGDVAGPVHIAVLTFNRTLRGYVKALAEEHALAQGETDLEIATFASWAHNRIGSINLVGHEGSSAIWNFGWNLGFERSFLLDEVDYVLGRFLPDDLGAYLDAERKGRGRSPRVLRSQKEAILEQVVLPYQQWKDTNGLNDWNDVASRLADQQHGPLLHVAIVDETQDFSANQVRAVLNHMAEESTTTFVIDSSQQIYPRHFRWPEVGLNVAGHVQTLATNYRNTRQIAAFARPLLEGIERQDDGSLPNFESCRTDGQLPTVVAGKFRTQMDWLISDLRAKLASGDDAAILHAQGGGWFSEVRRRLDQADISYVEIARASEWPDGPEAVALSTMHSAKGLEFDHVYVVGLNAEATPHGVEPGDAMLENYRRLLAMAIGRARKSVMVGYKPAEASALVSHLDDATFHFESR